MLNLFFINRKVKRIHRRESDGGLLALGEGKIKLDYSLAGVRMVNNKSFEFVLSFMFQTSFAKILIRNIEKERILGTQLPFKM